jgi:hypothetical protein
LAYTNRLAPQVTEHLDEGERLLAGVRAAPKGASLLIGISAGIGVAVGYVIATSAAEGPLAAALGGGLGAAAGVIVAFGISLIRLRGTDLESPNLALALTDRRLLVLTRSAVTNRSIRLSREYPISRIESISAGTSRLGFPAPVTVALRESDDLFLEVARIDDPAAFAAAFAAHSGR